MLAVRSSAGQGRYEAPFEWDVVFEAISRPGGRPLVWCHGNNGSATGDYNFYNAELRLLAQRHTVMAADLGGNTFGNDTGITRVGQAIDRLVALGASEPAILVGASMGGAVALNFAVRHPERVAAVAGIIPALTLSVPPGNPAEAAIDAAYPPAYDPGNPAHLDHDPLAFAGDLPADMPIGIWYSTTDPLCLPETAIAFGAARTQTRLVPFGPYGHSGIDIAVPSAAEWLASLDVVQPSGNAYGQGAYGSGIYGGAS